MTAPNIPPSYLCGMRAPAAAAAALTILMAAAPPALAAEFFMVTDLGNQFPIDVHVSELGTVEDYVRLLPFSARIVHDDPEGVLIFNDGCNSILDPASPDDCGMEVMRPYVHYDGPTTGMIAEFDEADSRVGDIPDVFRAFYSDGRGKPSLHERAFHAIAPHTANVQHHWVGGTNQTVNVAANKLTFAGPTPGGAPNTFIVEILDGTPTFSVRGDLAEGTTVRIIETFVPMLDIIRGYPAGIVQRTPSFTGDFFYYGAGRNATDPQSPYVYMLVNATENGTTDVSSGIYGDAYGHDFLEITPSGPNRFSFVTMIEDTIHDVGLYWAKPLGTPITTKYPVSFYGDGYQPKFHMHDLPMHCEEPRHACDGTIVFDHRNGEAMMTGSGDDVVINVYSSVKIPIMFDLEIQEARLVGDGLPDLRLPYLDGEYAADGGDAYFPVIPRYGGLAFEVEDTPTRMEYVDVLGSGSMKISDSVSSTESGSTGTTPKAGLPRGEIRDEQACAIAYSSTIASDHGDLKVRISADVIGGGHVENGKVIGGLAPPAVEEMAWATPAGQGVRSIPGIGSPVEVWMRLFVNGEERTIGSGGASVDSECGDFAKGKRVLLSGSSAVTDRRGVAVADSHVFTDPIERAAGGDREASARIGYDFGGLWIDRHVEVIPGLSEGDYVEFYLAVVADIIGLVPESVAGPYPVGLVEFEWADSEVTVGLRHPTVTTSI